jgi:hypothetical protein
MRKKALTTVSVATVTLQIEALSERRRPLRAIERHVIEGLKAHGEAEEDIRDAIYKGIDSRIIYRQGVLLVIT